MTVYRQRIGDIRRHRKVLRRCVGLVRKLDETIGFTVPFDLTEFLDRWGTRRGRPVRLLPMTAVELPPGTCGLWLALSDEDVIGYPENVPDNHRDHIVLHEIGHMLAGHSSSCAAKVGLAALMPDLDPAMVRSVLGRSLYSDPQELEAELFASLVFERTLGHVRGMRSSGQHDGVLERLENTLDP